MNLSKIIAAGLGVLALSQVPTAEASCAGPKNATFSTCFFGGSSGQGTRQASQVKADLATGTSATLGLFNSSGASIPTSTCPRPVDTIQGLGNLSFNAIRVCASAQSIQLVVTGP